MPNGWMPGVPQAPCPNPGGLIFVTAGVVHDTIGSWPGDRDYVQANSLAHWTIGPDWGEWSQHARVDLFLPHCNGANRRGPGIEFSRQFAGQRLNTPWQQFAWTLIRGWMLDEWGVPDQYLDPDSVPAASVWVNGGAYSGWISHLSVKTDDNSSQHTDYVQVADFLVPAPPVPLRKDDPMISTQVTPDGTLHVFAVATDNKVWTNARLTSGQWTGWNLLPAGVHDPAVRA